METTVLDDGSTLRHHRAGVCQGDVCPLHNPSDHDLRKYPLLWSDEWGVLYRNVKGMPVIDPDEYRIRNLAKGETYILRNSAKCPTCKVELVSRHRHDFVGCPCGQFVDGGHDYIRRTTGLIDTSVIYTKE